MQSLSPSPPPSTASAPVAAILAAAAAAASLFFGLIRQERSCTFLGIRVINIAHVSIKWIAEVLSTDSRGH